MSCWLEPRGGEQPHRILQPSVLYWYGRALADDERVAERARGEAMIAAAVDDFRRLGMASHVALAGR